jgi:hypothetical protein
MREAGMTTTTQAVQRRLDEIRYGYGVSSVTDDRTEALALLDLVTALLEEREALKQYDESPWTREVERSLDTAERATDTALRRFAGEE